MDSLPPPLSRDKTPWSDEDDDMLAELFLMRPTVEGDRVIMPPDTDEIAARLGRSYRSVAARASRLRLKRQSGGKMRPAS